MATINIFVSRAGNSNQIKLKDSEGHNPGNDDITTLVNPGDVIIWQLDDNSGLYSLDGVEIKGDSPYNLLSVAPTGRDNVFTASVTRASPGQGAIEKYKIGYTINRGEQTQWDDPKLQMNN
ncbi:hypothetical protein [Flavobacterium orientale]|uniref:Uncharacterized protein n=1 Tax=Flavobacterium orientale TaxID=1756020 RepID=A0A917DD64_9FLAO|nr:hypothetical protein [Flavobacterium orientale]GGD30387.1 hypothetical protein GCM10011343_20710 [Flavobacterium orientale]